MHYFSPSLFTMPRRQRLQHLTVYLMKDGRTRSNVLQSTSRLRPFYVRALDQNHPSLFVKANSPNAPRWLDYIRPHTDAQLSDVRTASSGAVLLFEARRRTFAVTFGQGRHLLDHEAFVKDFGLRVVLNAVAPEQLKSINARTIDEVPVHTRRDVSRDSSLSAFGFDPSRDLLRGVTGRPRDPQLAGRLTGSDALALQSYVKVPDLPMLGERLLELYMSNEYRRLRVR